MLRFDKAMHLSFRYKSILSVKLSNRLLGSDVFLFLQFINIVLVFVLYFYWIHDIAMYFFSDFFS